MDSETIREILLLECHGAIATAAKEAVEKLGQPRPYIDGAVQAGVPDPIEALKQSVQALKSSLVTYPPMGDSGTVLSRAEHDALTELSLTAEARAGLEKVIADAAAAAFFQFFCLIDGVGDPGLRTVHSWRGAAIREPVEDEDEPMLHDEFFDSYWHYRELSLT